MSVAGPVWVDLANSPHVLFFAPVLAELRRRGVTTFVTARDFAQTVALCAEFGIEATVVGAHGGADLPGKLANLRERVRALRRAAREARPAVAVSHNSYSHIVAARSLGIPAVTAMDYEFQPANHLAFRLASLVAVPDAFPLDRLRAQGARPRRTWRYPGLKEHIALAGFTPDPRYLAAHGLAADRPVVVVRPPATMALYHRFENPLFARVLRRLCDDHTLRVLVLPRTDEQARGLEGQGFGEMLWRGRPLDGRQLVAAADAVVSAGGSMNREAAVLGTPAWSVYAGKLGAVDRALVAGGRLRLVVGEYDVERVAIAKKPAGIAAVVDDRLLRAFVDRLLAVPQARG